MNLSVTLEETPELRVKQPRGGSKHHKPEYEPRMGRIYRAEKKYRKSRTHTGKGKTLRTHRP